MSQAVVDSTSELVVVSSQVDWNHQYQISSNMIAGQSKNASWWKFW